MKNWKVSFALGAVLAMAPLVRANVNVYGSDTPIIPGTLDSCLGCLFAYIQFPGSAAGQTVVSYQFYADATANPSNYLTPVLLEQSPSNVRDFTILGIGTPSTGFTDGAINNEPFVLAAGSAQVADGRTFFGYIDGDVTSFTLGTVVGNYGTIPSNYPTGPGVDGYFAGYPYSSDTQPPLSVTVGASFVTSEYSDVGQNPRTYSLQVTTTPEPGLYGILALGISGLVIGLQRRSRRA